MKIRKRMEDLKKEAISFIKNNCTIYPEHFSCMLNVLSEFKDQHGKDIHEVIDAMTEEERKQIFK